MKIDNARFIQPIQMEQMNPQLVNAAKGIEANFLKQMMRTMRACVPESEENQNNQALQIFRGMLDDHYAEEATRTRGIGIAELIVRYLTQQTQTNERPNTGNANLEKTELPTLENNNSVNDAK